MTETGSGAGPAPADLRAALAQFAGNGAIITAGRGEDRTGLFCTSVVAPTQDPPRYLACIGAAASTLPAIERHGCFGVNSLTPAHEGLARRFAGFGGVKGAARYEGAEWVTLTTGAPILADAAAALDCALEEVIRRDGYAIVIGRVRAVRVTAGAGGLVWWQGGFRPLTA